MSGRGTRRLLIAGCLGVLLIAAEQGVRTVRPALAHLRPSRVLVTPAEREQARAALPRLEDVRLRTADGIELVGWFSPGPKRSAVVLVHGLGSNRAQLLPEAGILARHGHGVLLLDSRASGESGGTVTTWGDQERLDVRAALDWVSARPEVDPSAIGMYGFSVGATPAALVAATDARVRALALGPTWTSLRDELADKFRARSGRSAALAALVFRLHGTDVDALAPERAVAALAPRPLFLMSGSEDPDTPPAVMRRLAAHAPGAELWILPGAAHGGYAGVDPAGLERRFSAFFDRALGDQHPLEH